MVAQEHTPGLAEVLVLVRREQLIALAINLDRLTFDRADSYKFVIELDGSPEKELYFRVNQVLQPGPIVG